MNEIINIADWPCINQMEIVLASTLVKVHNPAS